MATRTLSSIVGGGYEKFGNNKTARYIAIKGSRGSKKSTTISLWMIWQFLKEWRKGNGISMLCIRRWYATIKNSCFNQLIWAIERLGVEKLGKVYRVPLMLRFLPTGGEIIFAGLDKGTKITSITPPAGTFLTTVGFEEAFELADPAEVDKVDLSLRGKLPDGIIHRLIFSFNPGTEFWVKERYFDRVNEKTGLSKDGRILAFTTDYRCNEFLDKEFIAIMEDIAEHYPRRAEVEVGGNGGVSGDVIFENWEIQPFEFQSTLHYFFNGKQNRYPIAGLDFGFVDETAYIIGIIDEIQRIIFIYDEFYKSHTTNLDLIDNIKAKGYENFVFHADSASPLNIEEMIREGLNVVPCRKGRDSVIMGIVKIQDYRIIVHPRCENTIMALKNYHWELDAKSGKPTEEPAHEYSHIPDALRYAVEDARSFNYRFLA